MKITPRIIGTGHFLGSEIITNDQLCNALDISNDWIIERTGIRERRRASDSEYTSTLGIQASLRALKSANLEAGEIDAIICTTVTPDYCQMPSTACLIQAELGAKRAFAFDLAAACSGFIYGLEVASNFIKAGSYQNVLLVSADLMTRYVDYQDLGTSAIFADGAGAVVIANSKSENGILASDIGSDGNFADYISIQGGGTRQPASCQSVQNKQHFMKMRGRELFKMAVRTMTQTSQTVLEKAALSIEDIQLVIPHQANQRIIDAVAEKMNIPNEKIFSNVEFIGNTGAATIPIALDQSLAEGKIKQGDVVLLTAFGCGVTWGSTLLRW